MKYYQQSWFDMAFVTVDDMRELQVQYNISDHDK